MGEPQSIAGRVLAEKYLLIERLGEGGFGAIWRAEHQVLKSPVAVKLIDLEVARREGAVERFLREAQATAALRSPHVVQVLDYGLDHREENGTVSEQPFIVMELLEGENLAERIARIGALSPLDVVRVVTHVARAMSRAHELGIVHRDLKPENIFLVNNGDEEVAKVLDFGVAKIASPMDLHGQTYTQTGSLVGTPYYMSPEQAQGNKTVDHRSDLWALGVIAFEMLTGKRPFDSDALGDLVLCICVRDIPIPSQCGPVPAGFDAWFARAVARDPEQRFQSARELALALLELVENGDKGLRFTQFEDARARATSSRIDLRNRESSGASPEIPSRPAHSPFAATVRDPAFSASMLGNPAITPQPLVPAAEEPAETRLAPWALFGMAVLALAAGAAAVYGLFYLLRDPEPIDALAPVDSTTVKNARRSTHASGAERSRPPAAGASRPTVTPQTSALPFASGKPATDSTPNVIPGTRGSQEETPVGGGGRRIPANDVKPTEPTSPHPSGGNVPAPPPSTRTAPETPHTGGSAPIEPNRPAPNPIDALPMVTDPN
jgi:serine/threonine-protein kinase